VLCFIFKVSRYFREIYRSLPVTRALKRAIYEIAIVYVPDFESKQKAVRWQ